MHPYFNCHSFSIHSISLVPHPRINAHAVFNHKPLRTNYHFFHPISLFLSLLLLLLTVTTTSNAQTIPPPLRQFAFVKYDNKLYIQGGITANKATSNSLYALNLDTTWPATASSWTTLTGGNWAAHHAMVAVKPEHSAGLGTGAKGYLLTIGGYPSPSGGFWSAYDIQTGIWINLTTPAPYPGLEGHSAVSDPQTGLVYIMGGFYINNIVPSTQVANDLTVFDPNTGKVVQQTTASQLFNTSGSSAVWSTKRKSVLLLFGWSIAINIDAIYGIQYRVLKELNVTSNTWSNVTTIGTFPQYTMDACAVESEDGSKIMIAGGVQNIYTNHVSVSVFDVTTGQWSTGPDMPAPRSQFACASHADLFMVLGGTTSIDETTGTLFPSQVLLLDINKNIWENHEETSNKTTIIGGAVGGGMVFLGVCMVVRVWLIKRRRVGRRKRSRDGMESGDIKNVPGAQHLTGEARVPLSDEKGARLKENITFITTSDDNITAPVTAGQHADRKEYAGGEKSELAWSLDLENISRGLPLETGSTLHRRAGENRQLSDTTTLTLAPILDPAAYYQHLLDQQRQLQRQHPELFSPRSPQAVLEGKDNLDVAPLEVKGDPPKLSSENTSNNYSQPWEPPLGLRDLMVPPQPGSPHTRIQEVANKKDMEDLISLGKSEDSKRLTTSTSTTPTSVKRAISLTKKNFSVVPRAPHTHITTSAMDVILSPNSK